MVSLNWNKRPDCSEVLAKCHKWSIDRNIVTHNPEFEYTPIPYSTTHAILNAPVFQLKTILDSMDCGLKWHKGPDCWQVLDKYKD
ncbi:unnamed protein product [Oppiella nova]|uniref:Uncharacterized protein n=1 Tax=Oppiella nova TaxID=334625 RepID=A0A7R9QTP1_9ACAR|nr:unnamed protein product [Oppiella nova]CAG2174519.1 unnamed protein product [Oppiella nova]